ncbi:MAG: hypothetical protein UHP11_06600 [Anaerovoracaceae bacterium]|nr:hypothetical protein [Anaerovoracaceae bacterium]
MNNIQDLNKILFERIEALEDNDLSDEALNREITKTDAIVKVSTTILNNAKLALEAQKQFDEYGTGRTVDIPLLGITNENLAIENKNLRRRLAQKEAYYE